MGLNTTDLSVFRAMISLALVVQLSKKEIITVVPVRLHGVDLQSPEQLMFLLTGQLQDLFDHASALELVGI